MLKGKLKKYRRTVKVKKDERERTQSKGSGP